MSIKVLIKRNDYPSDTYVLSEGEMAFAIKTGEFFVGDGEHVMTELKSFKNIVAGDDGYMYLVRVDKDGKPHAELMQGKYRNIVNHIINDGTDSIQYERYIFKHNDK